MSIDRQDVYFALSWRSGLLKIGVSWAPEERLGQLERPSIRWDPDTGKPIYGLRLCLLAIEPAAGRRREEELHRRFDEWRVNPNELPDPEWWASGSSEWFRYEGEVRRHVEGLLHAP